jgi:hypothetical protein
MTSNFRCSRVRRSHTQLAIAKTAPARRRRADPIFRSSVDGVFRNPPCPPNKTRSAENASCFRALGRRRFLNLFDWRMGSSPDERSVGLPILAILTKPIYSNRNNGHVRLSTDLFLMILWRGLFAYSALLLCKRTPGPPPFSSMNSKAASSI